MAEAESTMPLVIFTPQYHRQDPLADDDQEDAFDPSHVIALLSTPALRGRVILQCSRVDLCLQLTVKVAEAAQCPLIVHSGWDPHVIDLGTDGRLADPEEIYSLCGSLGSEFRVLPGDRDEEKRGEYAQRIQSMASEKCDKIRVVCVSASVFYLLTRDFPVSVTKPLFACINMPSPIADCYAWDEDDVRRQVLGDLSKSNSSVQLKEFRGDEAIDPLSSSISVKENMLRVHKLIVVLLSPAVVEDADFLSAAVEKLRSPSIHLLSIAAPSDLSQFSDVLSARLGTAVEVDNRWDQEVVNQEDFHARILRPEEEHEKSETVLVVCSKTEVISTVLRVLFKEDHSEDIPYAEIDIAHPENLVLAKNREELLDSLKIKPSTEEAKEPPPRPVLAQEESNAAAEERKSESPRPDAISQGESETLMSLLATQISAPTDDSKSLDLESMPLAVSARNSMNYEESGERPQSPSFQVEHGLLSGIATEKSEETPAVDGSMADLVGSRPEALEKDAEPEAPPVASPPLTEPPQVASNRFAFVPLFASEIVDSSTRVPPLYTASTQPVTALGQQIARPPVVMPPVFPPEKVISPGEVQVASPEQMIQPEEVHAFPPVQVIPSEEVPVFSHVPAFPPEEVPAFPPVQVIPSEQLPAFSYVPAFPPEEVPVFPPVQVISSEQHPAFSYEQMIPPHIGFPPFEESKEVPAAIASQETTLEQCSEPNPYEEYLGSQPPVAAASVPGDCSPPEVTAESLHFARVMELNGYANELISRRVVDTLQSFHGTKPENPREEIEAVQSALSTLQSRFCHCMGTLNATLTTLAESQNTAARDVNRLIDDMKEIQRQKAAIHESAVELTQQLLHNIQKLQRAVEEKERCEPDLLNSLSLLQKPTPKLPAITLKQVIVDLQQRLYVLLDYRRPFARKVFWRLSKDQENSVWNEATVSKDEQYIQIYSKVLSEPGLLTLEVKTTLEAKKCVSLQFLNPYHPFDFSGTLFAQHYAHLQSLEERLGGEGFELFKRVAVAWINPSIELMEPFIQEFQQSYTQELPFLVQALSQRGFALGGEFQPARY